MARTTATLTNVPNVCKRVDILGMRICTVCVVMGGVFRCWLGKQHSGKGNNGVDKNR
jgi:hypothetical protein